MKIVVLTKEVLDTWGERRIDTATGLADRAASDAVLDEICERALEFAVATAERTPGTEVVTISMAPASAEGSVRRTLAIGADSAVQVVDDGLVGADITLTAATLAAAVRRTGFDLVVTGNRSTDGAGGVMAAMLAELLEVPSATNLDRVALDGSTLSASRSSDGVSQEVTVDLPAIISITERMPEARFPSFRGVLAAKKKPLETVSLATLAVQADEPSTAHSIVVAAAERAARAAGVTIVDEGDAGDRLASYLVENRLA